MDVNPWWVAIGFGGQALFSARFIIQWLASEKARRSIVPRAFWWFSLAGGMTLLAYAIHRQDPVFIAGQGAGLLIYLRNLSLIKRDRASRQQAASDDASSVEKPTASSKAREPEGSLLAAGDSRLRAEHARLAEENARLTHEVARLEARSARHKASCA
ncbi:lipid-A-disaccharide synthase N-terminal domain-containing protein [Cobetia marina]|uniref:lipid-A-disaccharide synthase N-terminal domain-containing protein n=1 Tax=Cobetia marina TaxID=28258 RepID=UPI00174A42AB